jgi:hypothetical protein
MTDPNQRPDGHKLFEKSFKAGEAAISSRRRTAMLRCLIDSNNSLIR